jgi:MFS family permease
MPNHGAPSGDGPATTVRGAGTALTLLLAINLFNYLDRQVLASVEPEIRRTLFGLSEPQIQASNIGLLASPGGAGALVAASTLQADRYRTNPKFWTGLLSTAFLVTYMVIAPVFGRLADRYPRWALVGFGVILWSLASGGSGMEWGVGIVAAYWLLLMTRCLVGVGEGAYMPVAPAMISDMYPVKRRGQVLSWFFLAIPVGGALGYSLGEICKYTLGWRWAFYLVVPPGILLGLLCFLMREPPRGQADNVNVEPGVPRQGGLAGLLIDLRRLMAIPSYCYNTPGMTAMTFAIGALAYWMPAFLEHRHVGPIFGIGPRTFFGILTALAGLLGTLSGGLSGDWLRRYVSGSYFLVSGVAFIAGFPMVLLFLTLPFPLAWVFVFLGVFCLFFNTGPTNAILANVTHPRERAMGFALNILIIHAFGDAISPPLIGWIADLTSIDFSFTVVSFTMLAGGLLWMWGARYLERDTALAPQRNV